MSFEREGVSRASFAVEVARSEEERRAGLAGIRELAPGEGLVLIFPGESEVCITNSAIPYAIDVVFTDADTVLEVERDVAAMTGTLPCHRASHVVEVRAGEAAVIEVGDAVVYTRLE